MIRNNLNFITNILVIIFISCNTVNQENVSENNIKEQIPILNINEVIDSISVNLEDITEWFKFVRLETNDSVQVGDSRYNTYVINENFILVTGAESSKKLLQFNIEGEFLKTAATKGKGPNEFFSLTKGFICDSNLFWKDHQKTPNGFCKLNLNSGIVEIIPMAKRGVVQDFTFISDSIILVIYSKNISSFKLTAEMFTQNNYGNLLYEGFSCTNNGLNELSTHFSLHKINNKVYISDPYCDSIVEFRNNIFNPVWYNHIFPKYKPGNFYKKIPWIQMKHFSEDFLLLTKTNVEVRKDGGKLYRDKKQIIIDRKNNSSGIIKHIYIKEFDFEIYKRFNTANENIFYIEYSAFDFKAKITKSLKNGRLSQENMQNLHILNSEILENDNPILLIRKFR